MASSVASTTASNKGERASSPSRERAGAREAPKAIRFVVEKAMAKSPLPLLPVEPVRAIPRNARAASRRSWRASSGASVAITIMHEPSAGFREGETELRSEEHTSELQSHSD